MVAIRDIPGGLEIELFKPITSTEFDAVEFNLKQWTYVPTNGYGGRNFGTEALTLAKKELVADGKRIRLSLPGIRDNSPPFITHGAYSNENVGWVIEVRLDKLQLYKNTGWYTMVRHQGGGNLSAVTAAIDIKKDPLAYAKAQYSAVCAACHSLDGSRLAGPSFKGLHGKKQQVIRAGKSVDVTVDDAYLLRAINTPLAEAPAGYPPAMPDLNLAEAEQRALVEWVKTLK